MILTHGGRHTLDERHRFAGYVKLPEDREYEKAEWEELRLCKYALDLVEQPEAGCISAPVFIELKQAAFEQRHDTYALTQAFMACYEARLFPPEWVLKGMYETFSKWERHNLSGEERTLDSVLRAGTKTQWRKRAYDPVLLGLESRYLQLKYYWGLNDENIFSILAFHICENGIEGEDGIKHTKLTFTPRTIKELHQKEKWSKSYEFMKENIYDSEKPSLTQEEVDNILSDYPKKALELIAKHKKREPTMDYTQD